MRAWFVAAVVLLGCGRTDLQPLPQPADAPPCVPRHGRLGVSRYPIVSSLAAHGEDLFVASHERFIPMKYRTAGAVERLSTCTEGEATSLLAGEDHPGSIQASAGWVHWTTADHDAVGENLGFLVRSRARGTPALISRRLDPRVPSVAGPLLAGDGRMWILAGRQLKSGDEGQLGLVDLTLSTGTELYAERVWVGRSSPDASVGVFGPSGEPTPLWQTRYDVVVFGVDAGHLFYQAWDETAARLQVVRRALGPSAQPEVVFLPAERALRGTVGAGQLFVVERRRLVQVTLATGRARELWTPKEKDDEVTAVAIDRDRVIYAVGNPYGMKGAELWAVGLNPDT